MNPYAALLKYDQFIVCRDKIPVDPLTRGAVSPHDSKNWMSYANAKKCADVLGAGFGVGFAITEADPINCIDIDCDKKLPAGTPWSKQVLEVCNTFTGALVEVSQSGRALHIFFTGPITPHSCKNGAKGLELYSHKRYILLGDMSTAIGDARFVPPPGVVSQFVTEYFPQKVVEKDAEWRDAPIHEWDGIADNTKLIQKFLASKPSAAAAFGSKATIGALWDADESVLANAYPSPTGDVYDRSSADAALLSHLAFWTGKDSERMDVLFRQSKLIRDKWEDRDDYRTMSINNANANCSRVYGQLIDRKACESEEMPVVNTVSDTVHEIDLNKIVERAGYQVLHIDDQKKHFEGCIYIGNEHKVFSSITGITYKPEVFKVAFGGYTFYQDFQGDKQTHSAWESFSQSLNLTFPRGDMACFRPIHPPGKILREEGITLVNKYVPIKTPCHKGDIAPWMGLVYKLWPVESDREIILAYLAACVQYIGYKFTWAPLVQGMQGNGKTFIGQTLAHCLGWRYTHKPHADDIGNNFNAWLLNKLFILIEELYVRNKPHIVDSIKTMITDTRQQFTPKGVDQFLGDNFANFWINTNYKECMKLVGTDRRYCIFYTPQQTLEDLEKWGMDGDYFPELWDWAINRNGYAMVHHYLKEYKIPRHLNPSIVTRAPFTTSTEEVFEISRGAVEQKIVDLSEEGQPGFNGGYLSSMAINNMLKNEFKGRSINGRRLKEMVFSLGYMLHPGLPSGRSPMMLMSEGGKPSIYIKKDHLFVNLQGHLAIVNHYLQAQGKPPIDTTVSIT